MSRLSLSNLKCSASRLKMCILRAIDEIPSRLSCCRLHRRWRCKYLGTRTRYPLNQASSSHHHIESTASSSSSYERREGWVRKMMAKGGEGGAGKLCLLLTKPGRVLRFGLKTASTFWGRPDWSETPQFGWCNMWTQPKTTFSSSCLQNHHYFGEEGEEARSSLACASVQASRSRLKARPRLLAMLDIFGPVKISSILSKFFGAIAGGYFV